MRVAFSDPQGPRLWRVAPYLAPLALFLFACLGPFSGATAVLLAVLGVASFHAVGALPLRQSSRKAAELTPLPGCVELRNAGSRNQRIHARSIVGATTARSETGIMFTLAHADRDQPITIEVESDADAERIRAALGIGHGGFGSIGWRTLPSSTAKTAFWARIVAAALGAFIVALGIFVSDTAAIILGTTTGQFALIAIVLSVAGYFAKNTPPTVAMSPEGLRLHTQAGWFTVPYDHVLGVEPIQNGLRFHVPPPYGFVDVRTSSTRVNTGLTDDQRDVLIAQIMSAAARARGLGPQKSDVTGRVDALRRNGESARDWLVRLDMAGRMLEGSAAGYRGHTLDVEDLWTLLEDPEADPDLRTAAARVLRHSSKAETRVRIDAAVAAVRDDATNRRLRIAIEDDVDLASQELASLDAESDFNAVFAATSRAPSGR